MFLRYRSTAEFWDGHFSFEQILSSQKRQEYNFRMNVQKSAEFACWILQQAIKFRYHTQKGIEYQKCVKIIENDHTRMCVTKNVEKFDMMFLTNQSMKCKMKG